MYTLHLGNSLEILPTIETSSIDSIVCDPPYELGFMGSKWDATGIAYNVDLWREALRVLKPGGHLLAFSGSRTYHRMTCAIEDAGFEIRDQILWVYGSGFPKSLDVSKAIDKAAGAEREVIGYDEQKAKQQTASKSTVPYGGNGNTGDITAPATPAAKQWQGWGTALKPAHEPICVARKPLAKGLTVAANVLAHGTGAINIDGCRVGTEKHVIKGGGGGLGTGWGEKKEINIERTGRFPANLIHDGSDEVLALFPETTVCGGPKKTDHDSGMFGIGQPGAVYNKADGDNRNASRVFYCAKTSKKDRNDGCDSIPITAVAESADPRDGGRPSEPRANTHPTVKPTDLMRYLCRLVTPPGGIVLDPFMGSGSTGKAAMLEGFQFVGIEMEEAYHAIAKARIDDAHLIQFADML